ncbi:peroxiredoxin-like family protein [Photobacterium nomapromontoriensis]|uniref:peroxiredoxin-like family protein n=1 Tax=Photobacterium nomapromontoriensis TaxID=2910237 RepID=UPI003D11591F
MTTTKFTAGDPFPRIELPTLDGDTVAIGTPQAGADWRMVVVYRGKHCPLCTRYLNELEKYKADLAQLGIDIIAVSADSEIQAREQLSKLTVSYPIAYGLSLAQMKALGLYLSSPRSAQETDHVFAEPGLFVINDQGGVQLIDISNGPFARPELSTLVSGLGFIRNPENHYPIRGTYL